MWGSPNAYVGSDPVNQIDPSGHIVETLWDIASVGFDIYSLAHSIRCGSGKDVYEDAAVLAIDVAALALPFVVAVGAVLTKGGKIARLAERFGTTPERTALLERLITSEGGLNTSQTVAKQLAGQRSFIPSQSILDTIGSGERAVDPQGVSG